MMAMYEFEVATNVGLILVMPIPPSETVVVAVGFADEWILNRFV